MIVTIERGHDPVTEPNEPVQESKPAASSTPASAPTPVSAPVDSAATPTSAPASTPTPAPSPEPAGDSETPNESGDNVPAPDPDTQTPTPAPQPKPKHSRLQERIDTLTRQKYELQEENSDLRRRTGIGAPKPPVTAPTPAAPATTPSGVVLPPRPDRSSFPDDDDYIIALSSWSTAKDRIEEGRRAEADRQQREANTRKENWNKQLDIARDKYEDFDDVVSSSASVNIGTAALLAITSSKVGTDLAYYLGKHPDIAATYGNMTPAEAVMEIGKLSYRIEKGEVKISDPATTAAAVPASTPASTPSPASNPAPTPGTASPVIKPLITSVAPAPIKPGRGSVAPDVNPENLSYQEFKVMRERQIAERRSRR